MTESEIKRYLKKYERQVVKEYDNVDLEKVKLPSDFKERTLDKILYEQSLQKKVSTKRKNIFKTLTRVAVVVVVVGVFVFATSNINANIFGFDAWKTTISDKNSDGNVDIIYKKNIGSKENGGDKAKERISEIPEYVPKGFKFCKEEKDDVWIYNEWSKGAKYLFFTSERILKDAKYSGKNVESKKVKVSGYVGYIYEQVKGNRTLQWNDNERINTIGTDSNIDDSELLKMAESMYD